MLRLLASLAIAVPLLGGCDSGTAGAATPGGDAAGESSTAEASVPCVLASCEGLGAQCGYAPDGCGGKLYCGVCAGADSCGAAGPNRCGTGVCESKQCGELEAECGVVSDGCSDVIDCGTCKAPKTCGGSGVANKCGGGTSSKGGAGGTAIDSDGGNAQGGVAGASVGQGGQDAAWQTDAWDSDAEATDSEGETPACVLHWEPCEGLSCCAGQGQCVDCGGDGVLVCAHLKDCIEPP